MLPLYWAAVTSLKGKGEIYRVPPTLIPYMSTLENYKKYLHWKMEFILPIL